MTYDDLLPGDLMILIAAPQTFMRFVIEINVKCDTPYMTFFLFAADGLQKLQKLGSTAILKSRATGVTTSCAMECVSCDHYYARTSAQINCVMV